MQRETRLRGNPARRPTKCGGDLSAFAFLLTKLPNARPRKDRGARHVTSKERRRNAPGAETRVGAGPELVPSRAHWSWSKNHSGPRHPATDRGPELNHGSEWVVTVWLRDCEAMLAYGPHPKHRELMALQAEKYLVMDGKCVLDAVTSLVCPDSSQS